MKNIASKTCIVEIDETDIASTICIVEIDETDIASTTCIVEQFPVQPILWRDCQYNLYCGDR